MKHGAVKLIELYQKTLSPDHSWRSVRYPYGYCRHYPSCSEYTRLAILKHGVLKGSGLGVVRIVKCNPLSTPKVDLSHLE